MVTHMVVTSHMSLLSTWSVAPMTEEMNFFYFILILLYLNFNVSSYNMCLVEGKIVTK